MSDNGIPHVISLGAGVQSSTMALMAAHGLIKPMPVCAVFADTQWEPRAVYSWLNWLEGQLPFPVHRVTRGNIRAANVNARLRGKKEVGQRWASLPYFVQVKGQREAGRVMRQCTSEYKIAPIERYLKRELLGLRPRQRAPKTPVLVQWRGITTDEAQRMKDSRARWTLVRYPLAMEHNMSRADCLAWMARHGYPRPPRSACIGCPFHSNHEWRNLRDNSPAEWEDACDFDRRIRKAGGMRGDAFLHRSLKPLSEVDLSTDLDRGQLGLWGEECEGMCGL